MKAAPIEGQELKSWGILPGGKQISLDFITIDGETYRIVLPVDALSGLMMTLPRMLQSALDERFPGGCMRIVQQLGRWHLEKQTHGDHLILKLNTTDGFEVAFALNHQHAGSLGTALLETPNETESTLVRRLN
jgi:hypothetical protein